MEVSFQIEWNMIALIFLLIIKNDVLLFKYQADFHLVTKLKENRQHDRILFDLKGNI